MITLKSKAEIVSMQEGAAILAEAFRRAKAMIAPGVSTAALDKTIRSVIEENGAVPSFLGYAGFPASACISINDTLIHGIPSEEEILKEGDLVSLDIGVYYKGFHVDAARSYGVSPGPEANALMQAARDSFFLALEQCREGKRVGDISHAVETFVKEMGYGLVESYTGHGVGRELHEDPPVPNLGAPGKGPRLRAGMTLAIEPMITEGSPEVHVLSDGWTVKSRDGRLTAHYENTVLITDSEPLVLTLADEVNDG